MSSPATAAFLAAWRDLNTRVPVTLLEIAFPSPSTDTIRMASRECVLPDGSVWEHGFVGGKISEKMSLLDTGPNPTDCSCEILDRCYPFMASGVASDTFATHQWQGATVQIWFWNDVRDASGAQVLAYADLFRVYSGAIDSFDNPDGRIRLNLLQDTSWNRRTPPTKVDSTSYPNAADGSLDLVEPILMGDFSAFPMRSPHATSYGNKAKQEDCGGARGVVPLVLVDTGLDGAKAKLLAAGHECSDLLDRTNGLSVFIAGGDVLAPLDTAAITETLGSSSPNKAHLQLDNNGLLAYVGVRPVDVRTSKTPGSIVNTATNPRNAMDVFEESTYASLAQVGTKDRLVLMMPNFSSLGYIEAVDAVMCYSGASGNTGNVQLKSLTTADVATTIITASATATSPTVVTASWPGYDQTWAFGGSVDVYVTFDSGTTNTAKVYWVALRVKYRPQLNMMTPGDLRRTRLEAYFPGDQMERFGVPYYKGNAPKYQLIGLFFANLKGAKDSAGTYTGTAGALIQTPPDMIRWFVDNYGAGVSFETTAGAFGSFTDARALLRNGGPSNYTLAARIGERTTVQQVVQRICEQSLCAVTMDHSSGKWLFHVWQPGAAADYDWPFSREDVSDLFVPGITSNTERAQGIRVQYGYDYFLGRPLFESYVTEDSSSQGYSQARTRDQRLVIDATCDRFDWKLGGWAGSPTYADSLTQATYTDPMDLAADVQDNVLRVRISTASYYTAAGYGHSVRTGFNDSLNFWYGATSTYYHATIPAGDYRPDEYWAEIAALMNATAGVSVFTASYNHATNKGTVVSSGSTFGFQSKFTSHTSPGSSAIWTMGFNLATGSGAAATSVTSAYAVYADRFWMNSESTATFQLLALSGANIANGCWGALGYDAQDTATQNQHLARLARGLGESDVQAAADAYGPADDLVITADFIRDEVVAQNFRDRLRQFRQRSRPDVRIRSPFCPDLQRMRVISFHDSVNERRAFGEYGSDGSWAAKAFRVLEIEKDLGPDYFTEFYAQKA